MPNFFDLLQVYMVPFAIAVPIGLLLIFFGVRKGNQEDIEDIPPPPPPLPPAPDLDLSQAPSHGVTVSPGGAIDLPLGAHDKTQVINLHKTGSDGPDTVLDANLARPTTRILVVDDSAVPRTKLKKLFESHGFEVETAADGVEAMEAVGKSKFSVIVTDLEMPNMDGFELIAAIQGSMETEDIPVIAITGHEEMQARVHNIQGLYGIFKKPWNDRELLKRVEVLAAIRR
jgi:CheY-like chemotaxis protein